MTSQQIKPTKAQLKSYWKRDWKGRISWKDFYANTKDWYLDFEIYFSENDIVEQYCGLDNEGGIR